MNKGRKMNVGRAEVENAEKNSKRNNKING